MTVEISAAELVANIRAKMDALPGDMAKAEQIVQNGAKNMQSGANTAGTGVGAKLGEGIKTGLSSFLGGGVGMLAGGAIAGGVALLTKEVIGTASELAELGRQSDRVGASFTQLWGSEAPDAMAKLRDASQGTISDMDLMLAANKASMLGVGSGVGDLTKLMQVAQERGRAMGLTTSQAFSDIVTGIGRMSPLILDNLGIVTGGEKTYAAYAASIGKAADALTDAEKKQALVNLVTAEATQGVADSAGQHEALAAAKANLRAEIGKNIDSWIQESGAIDAVTAAMQRRVASMQTYDERKAATAGREGQLQGAIRGLIDDRRELAGGWSRESGRAATEVNAQRLVHLSAEIDRLSEAYARGKVPAYEYQDRLRAIHTELAQLAGTSLPGVITMGEVYTNQQRVMASATSVTEVETARMAERMAEMESQGYAAAAGAQAAADGARAAGAGASAGSVGVDEMTAAMEYGAAKAAEYAAAMAAAASASDPRARALQTARQLNPYARDPSSQYSVDTSAAAGGAMGYGVHYGAVQRAVESTRWSTDQRRSAAVAAEREIGRARGGASRSAYEAEEKQAEQHYSRMVGIIQSALSPTAVTAADLAAAAAGTYVDKWDEYVRQIRMPDSGMDAAAIAEQERLFYSGQMLDQVNWAAIVSDVERKVAEEAGKEALLAEAMRRVQAAGIGASQVDVAQTLGLGTPQMMAAAQAEALQQGMTAAGMAVTFTETWRAEFEGQAERWTDMGAMAVQWMATGMERGATPQVTGLLVSLLAPRLYDALTGGRRP